MKFKEITVSEQPEEFCLNYPTGWIKAVGHLIKIDDLSFSAVPMDGVIKISEVRSGAKLFEVPIFEEVSNFDQTMNFLRIYAGPKIIKAIESVGIEYMRKNIEVIRKEGIKAHGDMPAVKTYDVEWLKADISEVLN